MERRHFDLKTSNLVAPAVRPLTLGDINNDGLSDIVLCDSTVWNSGEATALRFAISKGDGTFVENGTNISFNSFVTPFVTVQDFNGDNINDIAVFDSGTYYDFGTHGKEPTLFIGSASGIFLKSDAIKIAYQQIVSNKNESYRGGYQIDLTMGVKDIDVADVDGDGDLDFWIESTGGANATSHFLINNGVGGFFVDINNRVSNSLLFGPNYNKGAGPDYFRYGSGTFADINGDNKPDLILGQIRDNDPTHIDQSSFVLFNDGKGYYSGEQSIRLPLPKFFNGYTSVQDAVAYDIDNDGYKDIVLIHTRNDGVTGENVEPAWVGTYIQVLKNNKNTSFTDISDYYIGDQSTWSSATLTPANHAKKAALYDVNKDGRTDILLSYNSGVRPSDTAPIGFWAAPDGTFRPIDPWLITHGDRYFGEGVFPIDLNRDSLIDFIHLDKQPGPNNVYEKTKSDDFHTLIAQLSKLPLSIQTRWDVDGNAGQAYRLYKAALDRKPDDHGLAGWIKFMDDGGTLNVMAEQFINSQEFGAKYGALDNTGFVNQLYKNVLARNGEPAGIAGWVAGLNSGLSRADVLKGFSESSENQANVIGQIKNGIAYTEWWLA